MSRHEGDACVKWNGRIIFRVSVHQSGPADFAWAVYSASRTEQPLDSGSTASRPAAWGAARARISSIVELLFHALQDGEALGPDAPIEVPR